MCRSCLMAALAVAVTILGVPPAAASAQTLVPPNPVCLIGGCQEDKHDHGSHHTSCPFPATVVCAAGGAIVGGIGNAVGGGAQAGVGVGGNSVMGGLTRWGAGG